MTGAAAVALGGAASCSRRSYDGAAEMELKGGCIFLRERRISFVDGDVVHSVPTYSAVARITTRATYGQMRTGELGPVSSVG